jgi:hypothetical protein
VNAGICGTNHRRFCKFVCAIAAIGTGVPAFAQSEITAQPPSETGIEVDFSLDATTGIVTQQNSYWDAVNAVIPGLNFKSDLTTAEGFARPKVTIKMEAGENLSFYGTVSAIGSFTIGTDIFGTQDVVELGLDDLYAGVVIGSKENLYVDLSGGRMPHTVGNGAIVGDGGIDGSRTGALTFMPYRAWAQTAVAKIGYKGLSAEVFFVDAHEIATPNTETALAGFDMRYDIGLKNYFGVTMAEVVHSLTDYPQSQPNGSGVIPIPGGRDGMRFINFYAKLKPLPSTAPGLFMSADYVHQWNKNFKMSANLYRFRIGNQFAQWLLKPTFSYGITYSSGDDGNTASLERYDPVLSLGDDWAVGTATGQLIANSNLTIHRFQMDTVITPNDFLSLKYFIIRGNELNSPLAFQPPVGVTPPPFVVAGKEEGVDDYGLEYAHIFDKHFTASISAYYSEPGKSLENFAGAKLKGWFAGAIVLKYSY